MTNILSREQVGDCDNPPEYCSLRDSHLALLDENAALKEPDLRRVECIQSHAVRILELRDEIEKLKAELTELRREFEAYKEDCAEYMRGEDN